MTKWVALALGALLSLGGAVSIWNGVDVIQSERGWVAVIAGSVALTGGIMTFALFLLIREVQTLRASMALAPRIAAIPPPPPRAVPVPAEEPAPVQPILQETAAAAAPVHASAPLDSAPPSPPVIEPALRDSPVPEAPPHESLAFEQVFPPVPVAPTPVAAPAERFRFRPADAAIGMAAGAAAIGMFARSKAGSSSQDALPSQPPVTTEPEPQPQADAQPEQGPLAESVLEHLEEALQEPQEEAASEQASGDAPVEAPSIEPKAEEGGGDASKEDSTLSPGYAWLERALARDEGRKSPVLDWLRSRAPTELLIDPAAPAQEGQEEAPASENEAPPADEAASKAEAPAEAAPVEESATTAEEAAQASEPVAEPGVLGRYSSGGSDYTLYSDGSIDAQTEHGLFHFASMAELRAHIEAQNEQP